MNLMDFNTELFYKINELGRELPFLDGPMILVANYSLYLLILTVIFYLFKKGSNNQIMVISGLLSVGIAVLLGRVAGLFHSNKQPFAELSNVNQLIEKSVDNSFPSDHTMIFFAVCFTFFLFKKTGRYFWMAFACLVGFSRIWVGVHYPGDIIVAAILAILSATLLYTIVSKLTIFISNGEIKIPTTKEKNY